MAWLWASWDEYVTAIHPVVLRRGAFNLSQANTRLESVGRLLAAVEKLTNAIHALERLGFAVDRANLLREPSAVGDAFRPVEEAVDAGEDMLLYHKRLALSEASYGFLHAHDLLQHWDRYSKNWRIAHEIYQFLKDCRGLLDGYHQIARTDERFIINDVDLPPTLRIDFTTARNLFSVGFEEIGLLVAGRGLEGVLRQVAKDRKILMQTAKGKPRSASDVDFADLIEVIARVRWKVRDAPLISKHTKTMLHYLRTIRNSQAHPQPHGNSFQPAREVARVVAVTASSIWKEVSATRAKLDPTIVAKDW
jgi:hypothetical protein